MFGRIESWMLHKRYMFTLDNGEAFVGLLERRTKHSFVLQQATQWDRNGATQVDGRLIIERSRVLYLQEIGPPNNDHQ